MQKQLLKTILFLAAFLMLSQQVHSAVLFSDNFDAQSDWQPKADHGKTNDTSPAGGGVSCDYPDAICKTPPPTGWSYFRATGMWWGPLYQETLRIKATAADGTVAGRGGSGKAFIVYNEAQYGGSGDGWGADAILAKLFPQDYSELYARYYFRTQSNWRWTQGDRSLIKVFRSTHFNRSGSIFQYFANGGSGPAMVSDLSNSSNATSQEWGVEQNTGFYCFPQQTEFYCPHSPAGNKANYGTLYYKTNAPDGIVYPRSDDPHTPGLWADTNWHSFEYHLKMNTYAGNGSWNSDGVYEHWYDGVLQSSVKNIKWINSGTDTTIGWNTVELGGNANNSYLETWIRDGHVYNVNDTVVYNAKTYQCIIAHTSANDDRNPGAVKYWKQIAPYAGGGEQWYAIDDVVASTTYNGPPAQPASVTATKPTDTTARLTWTAGKNEAEYPLDGYRIYYGTSKTNLDKSIVVGKVTTYDIPNLTSGQTYYFAVTGFNKGATDPKETNENESIKSDIVSVGHGTTAPPAAPSGLVVQ